MSVGQFDNVWCAAGNFADVAHDVRGGVVESGRPQLEFALLSVGESARLDVSRPVFAARDDRPVDFAKALDVEGEVLVEGYYKATGEGDGVGINLVKLTKPISLGSLSCKSTRYTSLPSAISISQKRKACLIASLSNAI